MGKRIRRAGGLLLALMWFISLWGTPGLAAEPVEIPTRVLTGTEQASAIRANLNFADVRASNSFAREAIWEMGALELMKGYGATRFGLTDTLSVEQALAVAYVAAGREAEAQLAAEALDARRAADQKLFPAPKMWSDGYIQLAFNDGLITPAQYADALQTDQLALTGENFLRQASVTREDMAYYMAGVLGLASQYPQTRLFNAFTDWQTANPVRIPDIEAVLQNRVMNGDGNGRFRPKGFLTRAEAAQMLQNAAPVIYPLLGHTSHKGMIEGVDLQEDWVSGAKTVVRTVRIRHVDGTLHTLTLRQPTGNVAPTREEMTGRDVYRPSDTIVSLGGVPRDGSVLAAGQHIQYVVDAANGVPFVRVVPGTPEKTYVGRILSLDATTREMTYLPYQELPGAELEYVDQDTIARMANAKDTVRHVVSAAARVYSGEVRMLLSAVQPDDHAIITVTGGLVTYIEPVNLDLLQQDGVASGIVADNNASLGYITLYADDGSGTSAGIENGFRGLRTFAYAPRVTARRDGAAVAADAVIPGDSVFLKLNDAGEVVEIGASNDYAAIYGTLRGKTDTRVTLALPDGTTRTYPLTAEVPVYRDDVPARQSDMRVGDRIRMLVQTNADAVRVGEVRLERDPIPVGDIYRGTYVWYDPMNEQMTVTAAQTFTGGRWLPVDRHGALSFPLADGYDGELPPARAAAEAFFAVQEDIGGTPHIVAFSLRSPDAYEQVFDDTIAANAADGTRMSLAGRAAEFWTDPGSLIVKDGRLVDAAAVLAEERARLSAARDDVTGQMRVDVLVSETPTGAEGLSVYRGRIRTVAPDGAFTLESFARLDGNVWTFFNTPKTFSTVRDVTRLLSDGGVADLRAFNGTDWAGKAVYVLTDGSYAAAISDAAYGETVLKGRVVSVDGGVRDEWDTLVTEPTALSLSDTRRYDPLAYTWQATPGVSVSIPGDALVIRKGRQATLSQVQPGDIVRVLQTDVDGDARVVVAE